MTTATLTAIVMLLISGAIGMYIRKKIWGEQNKPKIALDYGRVWAAYIAFFIPISSIHLFLKKDVLNASVDFIISLIAFPFIALILGSIYGILKNFKIRDIQNHRILNTSTKLTTSAVILVASIFTIYFYLSNDDEQWISFYNANGITYYFDANSVSKKDGDTTVVIGSNKSLPASNKQFFYKTTYIFRCQSDRFRIGKTQAFEESKENGFGKVINTKEYAYRKSENIWEELEQWETITTGDDFLGSLINLRSSDSEKALYKLICKK